MAGKNGLRARQGTWAGTGCGAVVWAALLLGLVSAPALAMEPVGERRGPFLWSKTVEGTFGQVVDDLKTAVASMNFPVGTIKDYRVSLGRRLEQLGGGTLPFEHYQIIEFCNVQLALKALSTDLRIGIFMPCRMVVFAARGADRVTLMTVNPDFMVKALDNPEVRVFSTRVEAVIREIFLTVE